MSAPDPLERKLDRLAEDFVDRLRSGHSPDIADIARQHPELNDEIYSLFPLLQSLEVSKGSLHEPQRLLGDYVLTREVGRGGMGVVYEAIQSTLGRRVALKVLSKQLTRDERFLERFRLEAQAAARLSHPHVVPVIGWGEHEGSYFYTMQFVDGCGLDEALGHLQDPAPGDEWAAQLATHMRTTPWDRDPSPTPHETTTDIRTYVRNAARIMLQASMGIAAAHARGVLHRDVKPSNILIDRRRHVWIADFGLCKETDSGVLTAPGDLLGTFRYMAPERFEGTSDVQSDVYGLGMTLYELVTRTPAYDGNDRAAIAAQVVAAPPRPPRALEPGVPKDLERVILKAIHRDRSQRYATADALRSDLEAFLSGDPVSARPATLGYHLWASIRRHRALALLGAAAALALILSTVYYVRRLEEKEASARFREYAASIAAAETSLRDLDVSSARRALESAPTEYRHWEWAHLHSRLDRSVYSYPPWDVAVSAIAIRPGGAFLAASGQRKTRVYRRLTHEVALSIPHDSYVRALAWHPQGHELAIATYAGIEVVSWPRGESLWKKAIGVTRDLRYSGDGQLLVAGGHRGMLYAWHTTSREVASSIQVPSEIYAVAMLEADTTLLAVGTWDGRVRVFDAATGGKRWDWRSGDHGVTGMTPLEGGVLAATSSDGHIRAWDTRSGKQIRSFGPLSRPTGVAASASATHLAATSGPYIHVWDAARGSPVVTYCDDGDTTCMEFHPMEKEGVEQVVVSGTRRGTIHEWFVPPAHDVDVCVASESQLMCMAVAPNGHTFVTGGGSRILRHWDVRTRSERRNWMGHAGAINCVCFSPDGKWVASGDFLGELLIWNARADALAHRIQAVPSGSYKTGPWVRGVAFSADGTVVYSAGEDGALCAWDTDTGALLSRHVLSESAITAVKASPDANGLVLGFADGRIQVVDPSTNTVEATLRGHKSFVLGLAFAADGNTLASASRDGTVRLWNVSDASTVHVLRAVQTTSTGEADAFSSVDIHPSGARVVASGVDCSARVWDIKSGKLVATLRGEFGWMSGLGFAQSGKTLITCEDRGHIRFWHTQRLREQIGTLRTAAAQRQRVNRSVQEFVDAHGDHDRAIKALRNSTDRPPDAREAILQALYRARATPKALLKRLWRQFLRPDIEEDELHLAMSLANELAHVARHVGRQDQERETVRALGAYRMGHHVRVTSLAPMTREASRDRFPHLHAVDLLVQAMAHAKLGQIDHATRNWSTFAATKRKYVDLANDEKIIPLEQEARTLVSKLR